MKIRRAAPNPRVAEPKGRDHLYVGRVGSAVSNCDPYQNIVNVMFGVLRGDIEVAALFKDPRLFDFKLGVGLAAAAVLFAQSRVRELGLRVLVEALEVGVGWRGVEVIINLLHILAVVALVPTQTIEALFKNRITAVPEGQCKAQPLMVIADAEDTVLGPAVGTRTGVIVREELPCVAVGAVVFTDHAPG